MGPCISKSCKPAPKPLPIPPHQPLIIADTDPINHINPLCLRGSHPNKKKNLTSFNITDCDVTYTNNMDISPILVPRSSYNEKPLHKLKRESYELGNSNSKKSLFFQKKKESRLISQENLLFLKKNLEEYFRNRPKDELFYSNSHSPYLPPETSLKQPVCIKSPILPCNSFYKDENPEKKPINSEPLEEPPVLNISVIELEESNEENKGFNKETPSNEENKGFNKEIQENKGFNKENHYRNQLILLTQEILKDSQSSKEEGEIHWFGSLENRLKVIEKGEEGLMLRKYAKLWHHLNNAYQLKGLWIESLNSLLPLSSLYWQLELYKPLMICQIDAYMIQVMMLLGEKRQVLEEKPRELQRISMLICFIEEKVKKEVLGEITGSITFLKYFQGILIGNLQLCKQALKGFEEVQIVSREEYQDLWNFVVKLRIFCIFCIILFYFVLFLLNIFFLIESR